MTPSEMEKRILSLEEAVAAMRSGMNHGPATAEPWYIHQAGEFANDPLFEEMVRLGKRSRDSLGKKRKKKTAS